jgi:hypothetical protein
MNLRTPLIAGTLLVIAAGCASDPAPSAPAMSPTPPAATNMPAASPAKTMAVMAGCPDKDASHVLMHDEPVFLSMPGQGAAPVGVLKSGTKVLAMVPGSMYTKCTIADGKVVYVKTAGLKPTTN